MPANHSIFISYRRSDSEGETGRIDDHLSAHFGRDAVFRDVDSLPLGVDFRTHLNQTVDQCKVLIAVIGDRWLNELNQRFLNDETDWVREEIAWALEKEIIVVPVFVDSTKSVAAADLPMPVAALAYRNSAQVRPGSDFRPDMARLIRWLEEVVGKPDNRKETYVVVEGCRDRPALTQYLATTANRLKQRGSLAIRQNIAYESVQFKQVAKILDFEPGMGMRGEALFIFTEFAELNLSTLQQFSAQALTWARQEVNVKSAGQAFYNFRIPTHLCFAIAIVDQLDEATRTAIKTTNPIAKRVDVLWYEIPVVYELGAGTLHYYDKASSLLENFRGEVAWRKLRPIIQELLN